jgi:hypothetical protein
LVGETIGRLLSQRHEQAIHCGEPMTAYLPTDAGAVAGLELVGENPSTGDLGSLIEEGGSVLWRCPQAPPPGVYRVKRGDATVFAIASAIPAQESDLATLDPALFTTRLAGGRAVHYQASADSQDQKDDAWAWILVWCSACVLGELVVLKAFRT